ncbi:MAG TPA: hypothetical protein VL860_02190, partial [Planctomycetota bacterium]|nr:hypothetical protein [Planctomycetota bacterium]
PPATTASAPGMIAVPPAQPQRIRWIRLLLIGAPIAWVLLSVWYMTTRSDMARQREKAQLPDKMLTQYPNQPELAFGYWRRILDNPASNATSKTAAQTAIQSLIDNHGLSSRLEELVSDRVRRGENDFVEARAYAATLVYLDSNFKTKETVEQGQTRVARIEAIRSGYADAVNDRVARAQFEKSIEKMSALYAQYPEAEFVRPTIASMQAEISDSLISVDQLEEAVRRLEIAIQLDPIPLYVSKLNMLKADIEKLNPTAYLEKARAAEARGDREEAQSQYEAALRNRRTNKEAREGYTRILKFYAEIFLKNAEENNGELGEEAEKFCKLAAQNGKLLSQYGDDSLILARAELMLAESQFLEENIKQAKDLADTGINSIAVGQRGTRDGSYLMAKAFKLYYHLGKNMAKIPEAKQALLLAEQYCRYAMDKGHPMASRLFVQIQNLEQTEIDDASQVRAEVVTAPVDSVARGQDVRNLVNEGPLNAAAPVDGLLEDPGVRLKPADASTTPEKPAKAPPDHNPELDRLINPLR